MAEASILYRFGRRIGPVYWSCRDNWLWLTTVAIVVGSATFMIAAGRLEDAAHVGDIVAGVSAALAFLWLIASFRLQAREIALQRSELQLQREALQLQATELKNASKLASLSQVDAILSRATKRVAESGLGVEYPTDIHTKWVQGMALWKDILESTNSSQVHQNFLEWTKIEALARGYTASVASALKIYLEHHTSAVVDHSKTDEEFVYVYGPFMAKAPFLSEHQGTARIVSEFLFLTSPGLKAIRLAGLVSSSKEIGSRIFKDGALDELRSEIVSSKGKLPKIADTASSLG